MNYFTVIESLCSAATLPFLLEQAVRPLQESRIYCNINHFRLVLEELLCNISVYAYNNIPGPIKIALFTYKNPVHNVSFGMIVQDEGDPFDPASYQPNRSNTDRLMDVAPRGRGLLLVQHMVESLSYERCNNSKGVECNSLTVLFRKN